MCPPCLKMVTDINSWSRSWSLYPRTCSGWVDWFPILWTSCQNISSNGILKKVSVLAQHLPFRLFKNNRLTKKHKRYSNFDSSIAHGPDELFLLNDWLFQVPRKNTWCENQRARGLFFFFLPPPPSPADQARLIFELPVFATSLPDYLKAWHRLNKWHFQS